MKKNIYVELIKIIKKRSFMIFTLLLVILTILLTLFMKNDYKREHIYIDESTFGNEYQEYVDLVLEENELYDYILRNQIVEPNAVRGSLSVSYIILIFTSIYIVIISSNSFGFEYERNTIKWIMLNSRKREIFLSKLVSLFIIASFLMMLVFMINIIVVSIKYDLNLFKLSVFIVNNGNIMKKSLLIVHGCEYLKLFFPQILLISFSMFLGLLFKSSVSASALSVFTLLSGSLLTELFIKLKLRIVSYSFLPYLDFSIFQDKLGVSLYNIENMVNITQKNGVIINIIFSILFMILGSIIFNKRELK